MNTLAQAYAEIADTPIEDGTSNAAFNLVDRILEEQGEMEIADWVIDSSPSTIPWRDVATVLAIMIWSTSDNGAGIMREAERWLREGVDEQRIFVALNLDVYPFLDSKEMEECLRNASEKFPTQTELCLSLISSRKNAAKQALVSSSDKRGWVASLRAFFRRRG